MSRVITYEVGANTSRYNAAMDRAIHRHTQALGRITGKASEFQKSLEASHARVLAFGASAGAVYTLKRAFDFTVGSMIDVEKALVDINTLLGLNTQDLAKFRNELFATAVKTASSFKDASTAAAEFSRQGLSVEETLVRTEVALGITRLSGLELAESISSLTAAMNTFNKEGLTAIQFGDKLATVDARFAVSSGDLAQAIKRVGSTAEDSNVSLDEMLAVVTATQQKTARGGAIIGNAFKTIFTRLQRPQVIAQLEELGIKTREITGEVLPLMTILKQLAGGFDTLAPSVKAQTAELIGGVFQVNVLKAAMSDLGNGFSVYDSALKVASSSTGEFNRRNEELNQTLSAKLAQTLATSTNLFAKLGELSLKPVVSGGIGSLKNLVTDLDNILTVTNEFNPETGKNEKQAQGMGGELGHSIAVGLLSGIGAVLSGPGIQIISTVLTKLTIDFTKFFRDSARDLTGLTSDATRYKAAYKGISAHLEKHPEILASIGDGTRSIVQIQADVLAAITRNNQALAETDRLTSKIAGNQTGYSPNKPSILSRAASSVASATGMKTFAEGNNPAFSFEEAKARGLGASKNVKAHVSKGTINGKKFVMNDEEVEIVGAGANGDSAVLPSYTLTKSVADRLKKRYSDIPGSEDGTIGPGTLKKKKWYDIYDEKKKEALKKHKLITNFKNDKFNRNDFSPLGSFFASGFLPSNPMTLADGFSPMMGMGGGSSDIMTSILIGMAGTFGSSISKITQDLDGTTSKLTGFQDAVDAASDSLAKYNEERGTDERTISELETTTESNIKALKDSGESQKTAAYASIDQSADIDKANQESRRKTVGSILSSGKKRQETFDKDIENQNKGIESAKLEMDKIRKTEEAKMDAETEVAKSAAKTKRDAKFKEIQKTRNEKFQEAESAISSGKQNIENTQSRITSIAQDPVTKRFRTLTPEQKKKIKLLKDYQKANKQSVEAAEQRKVDAQKATYSASYKAKGDYTADLRDAQDTGDARKRLAMAALERPDSKKVDSFGRNIHRTSGFVSAWEQKRDETVERKRADRIETINRARAIRSDYKSSLTSIPAKAAKDKADFATNMDAVTNAQIDAQNNRLTSAKASAKSAEDLRRMDEEFAINIRHSQQEALDELTKKNEKIRAAEQKTQSRAMIGAIGLSMISGSGIAEKVGSGIGGEQGGKFAQETVEASAKSAQILSAIPGQYGQAAAAFMLVGSVMKSALSNFKGSGKKVAELESQLEVMKETVSRSNSAMNEYVQLLSPIKDAYYSTSITAKNLSEMQHRAAIALSKVPQELRGKISVATTDEEKSRLIGQAQEVNFKKQRELEMEVGLQKRVKAAEDRNLSIGIIGNDNSSAFTTSNIFGGRSKAQEKTDRADLSSFVSSTINNMDEDTMKKSIAILSTRKARMGTAKENLGDLAASGAISSDTAGSLNDEEAQNFVKQFRKQTIDIESSKLAVAQIDKLRKEDIKNMQSLNRELDIMNQIQKGILSDMNRGMNNFVKGVSSAISNLAKLGSAKREAEMTEVGVKTELAGLKYGAQTMNRIKGEGEKQKILTSSGNQLRDLNTSVGNAAAEEILRSVLSKSDTSVKNADGSEYVSEDALVAKNEITRMVEEQRKLGVTDPNEMLANIKKKTQDIQVFDDGAEVDVQKTENLKSQIQLGLENDGMKSKLNEMVTGQKEQTDAIKTNAKIAIDKADASIKAQERLIEAQRNARLFGNLPANKQEQKAIERQIKSDSRKSNKGDIYASNRLLALASGQFGDSLDESSVASLKGKVKVGEFERQKKIVGAFDKGGAVSGIRNQFSDARLRTISSDKVDSLLKTEDKGLDAKKFVTGGMSEELVESNKGLMRSLRSLEDTLKGRISADVDMINPNDLQGIAQRQEAANKKKLEVKTRQEALTKEREKDFNTMKNAFAEVLKGGFKTKVEGGVNVLVEGTQGLSGGIAEAVKAGVEEMIKNEVSYRFGQRAGAPAEVGR